MQERLKAWDSDTERSAVKAKYQLWVTQAEHDAIADILAACT